jgi:hypothetical protein
MRENIMMAEHIKLIGNGKSQIKCMIAHSRVSNTANGGRTNNVDLCTQWIRRFAVILM